MNEELYFKDAFTEVDGNINFDGNNINVNCITSKNSKFSLDSDGNLVVNSITTSTSNNNIDFDSIYPVGSIYLTVNNVNPSNLFGGTWEQIKDRFLIGASDIYTNGTIGGEAEHTLSVEEMPRHRHGFYWGNDGVGSDWAIALNWNSQRHLYSDGGDGQGVSYNGVSQPHNNMPPYLAVYIWKRIS